MIRTKVLLKLSNYQGIPYSGVYLHSLGSTLAKDGLLSSGPSGPRGRHAEDLSVGDWANILTSIAGASAAAKASAAIKVCNPLISTQSGMTWENYFRVILIHSDMGLTIDKVEIARNYPEIVVRYIDGQSMIFNKDGKDDPGRGKSCFKIVGIIPGALIQQTRLWMKDVKSGWVAEDGGPTTMDEFIKKNEAVKKKSEEE